MTIAVSLVLAVLLLVTAIRELTARPGRGQTYGRVGVPEERLNLLALILMAGAAGLVVGCGGNRWAWPVPAGLVASLCWPWRRTCATTTSSRCRRPWSSWHCRPRRWPST